MRSNNAVLKNPTCNPNIIHTWWKHLVGDGCTLSVRRRGYRNSSTHRGASPVGPAERRKRNPLVDISLHFANPVGRVASTGNKIVIHLESTISDSRRLQEKAQETEEDKDKRLAHIPPRCKPPSPYANEVERAAFTAVLQPGSNLGTGVTSNPLDKEACKPAGPQYPSFIFAQFWVRVISGARGQSR